MFTAGVSAQYIDELELDNYLQLIFDTGGALIALNNNKISACLLYTPIGFDQNCPAELFRLLDTDSSLYIAELMVAEPFRGRGLAKMLLQNFHKESIKRNVSNVVIRVWSENDIALNLYLNSGFLYAGEILQQKLMPDGLTPFTMKKLYLRKKLF